MASGRTAAGKRPGPWPTSVTAAGGRSPPSTSAGTARPPGRCADLTATRLLEELAAIRAFLAARGCPQLGLVGSSMGGFASAWFAVRHPEAVTGCVLLAPAFRFLERRFAELSEAALAEWQRAGVRRVRNEWVDVGDRLRAHGGAGRLRPR